MSEGKFNFQLKISKSVYYQDGSEYPVEIPFLQFQKDGNVTLKGSDSVGEFDFTGHIENIYIFLKKQYIGQHSLFYVGKLNQNKLNLFYSFQHDDNLGKEKVDNGEFNALIEFESENFKFFRHGDEGEDWQIFLNPLENGKSKGLGVIKGKTVKLSYKKKEEYGKLQMKYDNYEKTFKVETNEANHSMKVNDKVLLDTHKIVFLESNYTINEKKVNFYLPYLLLIDNSTFSYALEDMHGEFTIKGALEGNYFCFTKSYSGLLNTYFVGKFSGRNLNMVYSNSNEEGQPEALKKKVDLGEFTVNILMETTYFNFNYESKNSHAFLIRDSNNDNKLRGFVFHENKSHEAILKIKSGKNSKMKLKRGNVTRYLKVEFNQENFLISC
jgi:hypothetical protein